MTEQDWKDLGRRAVACREWRWMPGMSIIRRKTGPAGGTGLRPPHLRVALTCGHPCDPFACVADVDRLPRPCPPDPHWVPDFRDPATLGCLMALVREAYPGCAIWVARDCVVDPLDDTEYMLDEREGWTVCGGSGDDYLSPYGSGRTEAEALVAALEAAP